MEARAQSKAAAAPPMVTPQPVAPATPATMLERAITSGANVEVMEKLLALQERWEANQARKSFDAALSEIRDDLPAIIKTKAANFGQGRAAYKYEDLSEMIDQLSPCLAMHGLSFRWRTESTAPDSVTVSCILSHRDGHNESTSLTAKHDNSGGKNSIQAIGSVVTYLQRYTLKAALGIAASVDDDAQSAGRTVGARPGKPPIRQNDHPQAVNYIAILGKTILDFTGNDTKAAKEILFQVAGVKSLTELDQTSAMAAQMKFEKEFLSAGMNEDEAEAPVEREVGEEG